MGGRESTVLLQKWFLAGGYLLAAFAIYVSHVSPATGYEVSVYAGTPTAVWVACGMAMFLAGIVGFFAAGRRLLGGAVGLAAVVVTTVVALPVLRGYHFYGFNDSLTHLGLVRALEGGGDPLAFVYPATHVSSAVLAGFGGVADTLAMQLVFLAFALAYLVFVPLVAYRLVPDVRVAAVAAFAGFLFLPVNLNGFKLLYFPFSMSAFLTPLLLYLLVRHAEAGAAGTRPTEWWSPNAQFATRPAVLFVLVAAAMILAHPLAAGDALLICAGTVLAKRLFESRLIDGDEPEFRPISGITAVFAVLALAWASQFEATYDAAADLVWSVAAYATGRAGALGAISQRAGSANDVGASVGEVFLKLLLVEATFLVLAAGLVGALLAGRLGVLDRQLPGRFGPWDSEGEALCRYLGTATFLFAAYAALHLVGAISEVNFFFRHLGFLMIPGTVLGAIGLTSLGHVLAARRSYATVKRIGAVFAAVVLVLSLATVFPSPFVYLPSNHVTEQQTAGYATTFEYGGDVPLVTVRGVGDRYADGLGVGADRPFGAGLATWELTGPDPLVEPDEQVHFPVTRTARQREVVAYRGLRYSDAYFDSFASRPGVARVVSNGEFDLYAMRSEELTRSPGG